MEAFHQAVVRNRRGYLEEERSAIMGRVQERRLRTAQLDQQRSGILQILQSHSTNEQFTRLQSELNKKEGEVESLTREIEAARQIQNQKTLMKQERENLKERLQRANEEQTAALEKIQRTFESISEALYGDRKGTLTIKATTRGPEFRPKIHGERSSGINRMQIFALDLTLMSLWAARPKGPGFLIHDSHIFDGVDPVTIEKAVQVGHQRCEAEGWQYIVTMNSDTIPPSYGDPEILSRYALPVRLRDTPDGGLFGVEFDPDE